MLNERLPGLIKWHVNNMPMHYVILRVIATHLFLFTCQLTASASVFHVTLGENAINKKGNNELQKLDGTCRHTRQQEPGPEPAFWVRNRRFLLMVWNTNP